LFLTAALSFKKEFATRILTEFGRETLLFQKEKPISSNQWTVPRSRSWQTARNAFTKSSSMGPCLVKVGHGNNGYKTIEEFLPEAAE
jgi:hypothetical protein